MCIYPDSLKGKREAWASEGEWLKLLYYFLCVDENKTELFKFLSQQVTRLSTGEGKVIYAIDVLSTMTDADVTNLKQTCCTGTVR